MVFSIKAADKNDLSFIQDCANSAYQIYVERMGKKPAPMIADFAAQIELGHVEIILSDEQPAGYCVSFETSDALFVENIALSPVCQGKGLAAQMFAILEARARSAGLTKLALYTNEKMYENLALYPKIGFVEIERREEDGFRRVFFEKQLA